MIFQQNIVNLIKLWMNYIPKTKCYKFCQFKPGFLSQLVHTLPPLLASSLDESDTSKPSPKPEPWDPCWGSVLWGIPLTNNEARRTKVYLFIIVFVVVVVVVIVLVVVVLVVIVMRWWLLYLSLCWLSCCCLWLSYCWLSCGLPSSWLSLSWLTSFSISLSTALSPWLLSKRLLIMFYQAPV